MNAQTSPTPSPAPPSLPPDMTTRPTPGDDAKTCRICGCMLKSPAAPRGAARIASWILQIVAAVILLQTLFFKFTAAPEAVAIFDKLGVEPWGRLGAGVMELITAVLLLWPRFSILGALLAVGLMVGAIGSHLGPLGIVVNDDGGTLFVMALVVLACGIGVLVLRRNQIKALIHHPAGYLLGQD